ncbi:hypothetical protein LBMAG42_56410 [Deltaproteobacteria bacterium]|nr:hypothetical protein LBMAG42_56410 [Deltaproteobacteria bacterium]
MAQLALDLARLPVFAGVPRAALEASEPLWSVIRLESGQTFCREGDPGDSIAILAEGECSVSVGGIAIGKVARGELVGEVSAFFQDNTRSAELVAVAPTTLYVLSANRLARLRVGESPVYAALLKRALEEVGRRVLRANDRLTRLVEGSHQRPLRKDPSALARLWRALVPGKPPRPCPPLHPLLRALPRLKSADPGTLIVPSHRFRPIRSQAFLPVGSLGSRRVACPTAKPASS